jgi:NAD(P)-dependent dehydrogenase (short-subunit alcohol dehydrogenase family)
MDDIHCTVLITGTSSGIGLETAVEFASRGWNVVATMRNPDKRNTKLHGMGKKVDIVHLDVLDLDSIKSAVKYASDKYGGIDVLVNNAGYPLFGPFEECAREKVIKQVNTNYIGLMDVTREVLPVMRKKGSGTIIHVASVGGRAGFPLYSVYDATKFAVEGFTECSWYELRRLNIKVKVMQPGVIKTNFYGSSMQIAKDTGIGAYAEHVEMLEKANQKWGAKGSHPSVIARKIYKAATDGRSKMRYHAGSLSGLILGMRWILPDAIFMRMLDRLYK